MEAYYSHIADFILHFDRYLPVVMEAYGHWIYAFLFIIVFCETGLVNAVSAGRLAFVCLRRSGGYRRWFKPAAFNGYLFSGCRYRRRLQLRDWQALWA